MFSSSIRLYLFIGASVAIIALLAGSHWKAYRMGGDSVRVEWQAADARRKEGERQAILTRFRENEIAYRQQQETATKESKRHATEIQAIRSRHAADLSERVPIDPAKFCGGAAAGPKATETGSDGQADTGPAFLPDAFARSLFQITADAGEVAADLRTLKEQAKDCFAGS